VSVESIAIALHHSQARGTAKLVLLGIANHDGDGGAWPSIKTLMRYAGGADRRTVQRCIAQLVKLHEIRCDVQAGGDRDVSDGHRPNLYHFTLACPPHCDRSRQHRDLRQPLVTFQDDGAAPTPPGGTHAARGAALTPPKPSIEPSTKTEKKSSRDNRARARRGACGHTLVDERHCDYGCLPEQVSA
jgi:hypothetical protein